MLGHSGAVNCVRWSHSGAFLASCDDHGLSSIWRRNGTGVLSVLSLQLQTEAILHLDWRADDQVIATAGVDHSLRIWRVQGSGSGQLICTLRGHAEPANGCAWLGNDRLVSQANDWTLRVWNTATSKQERCIDGPFQNGALITTFQRLAVAQDGSFILGVHAKNGGGCTIQKIDAQSLAPQTDFVGYRKPVSVVVSALHNY